MTPISFAKKYPTKHVIIHFLRISSRGGGVPGGGGGGVCTSRKKVRNFATVHK